MQFSLLRHDPVSAEADEQLVRQHEAEIGELLPLLGPLFGFGVIAFSIWDYLIDPLQAHLTFATRVALVLLGAVAYWPNRLNWTPMQRNGLIYITHASAIIIALYLLDQGFIHGLTAVAACTFTLSVTTLRLKTFVLISLLPSLLFIALSALRQPLFEFVNGLALYLFALLLAGAIMLVIRFLRQRAFLLEQELTNIAQRDSLTGIYNRRYLSELAEREVALAQRHHRPLSLLMIDIDHFKSINDTFGHDIGDAVIRMVTETCVVNMRRIDHVGRIGGEEFVCVLPETDEAEALQCAERLRENIESLRVPSPLGAVRFTVSIGVAVLSVRHENWKALLKDADVALYRAKQSGRNRVMLPEQTTS